MKHKTIVASHEMSVPQKKANNLKSLLLGSNTALSSGNKPALSHDMAPHKYCYRKIKRDPIPAIQIEGTNCGKQPPKRRLIRRIGMVEAEIVWG